MSIALVVLVDLMTNAVTPSRLYDSNIYIGMAERGFSPDVLSSPFVYGFIPPFLAGSIHQFVGLSIYKSFKVITYTGLISQLFGIFLLVRHIARSEKAAFMGELVVAFSMCNVKYPLFDVHRSDNLADEFDLTISVTLPTSASKWNLIKHRLFCHIEANWAGVPLVNGETIIKFIRTTKTATGLSCRAYLDRREYVTGNHISKEQKDFIQLQPHRILPRWNYTIIPHEPCRKLEK